ncbi:MAG: 3-oxoacyl-ACP synthase III family protein [Planctomycetota bacterium]
MWVHGWGEHVPDTELTSAWLHEALGLERDLEWVRSRLGIERRYTALTRDYLLETRNQDPRAAMALARERGCTPLELGAAAAQRALNAAGVDAADVGWVLAACDTPLETLPSLAHRLAQVLGVGDGPHCDLNAGCASFARHMHLLGASDPARVPAWILCVQSSTYTLRTDYSPGCYDGYIWGDGAAAQLVSLVHPGPYRLEPLRFGSDPSGASLIRIDSAGHFRQEGARVREFSVRKTCELLESMAEEKGLYAETTWTVVHQANRVMQESILGHLGLPPERHLSNVGARGNTAAAGCPAAIAANLSRLAPGEPLLYAVLGAGLAWGGGYLQRTPSDP